MMSRLKTGSDRSGHARSTRQVLDNRTRRYPTGYTIPREAKGLLRAYSETRLAVSVATAVGDYVVIVIAALAAYLPARLVLDGHLMSVLTIALAIAAVALHLLAWIIIASRQRGLENLTHDGGHYNWSRHKFVNNLLSGFIAALPIFSWSRLFGDNHTPHHSWFGAEQRDTDRRRYGEGNFEDLNRSTLMAYSRGVLSRLPQYAKGWFRVSGAARVAIIGGLLWHLMFVILPLAYLVGFAEATLVWILYWVLPFFIFLTPLRFLAETAKHQYRSYGTVVDATVSNIGWIHRWLIHPHGDGYHTLHHLFPFVPHHQLKKLHDALVKLDPGYGAQLRYRTRVLEEPRRDADHL